MNEMYFRFRRICTWFVSQKWFDNLVLLFIALNCITLAMERPNIPPYSTERLFLSTANYVFTAVFTIEMLIKVIIHKRTNEIMNVLFICLSLSLFFFCLFLDLIKVVATGMFYGPDAYFTSGWNIMDGSLVTISIIDLLMSLISQSSPRIFGILRVNHHHHLFVRPSIIRVLNRTANTI